jgi:acetyl-CoA acyltransferase
MTVNRFCGSSMSSVHIAAGQIQLGAGEVFICAGVESMSRVPMMGFNPLPNARAGQEDGRLFRWATLLKTSPPVSDFACAAGSLCRREPGQGCLRHRCGQARGRDRPDPDQGRHRRQGRHAASGTTVEALPASACLCPGRNRNRRHIFTLTDGASAVLIASEDYALANGFPFWRGSSRSRSRVSARDHGHRSG